MSTLPTSGNTDLAGQIAIVEGVDSNVYQTRAAGEAVVRHPSAFTALETSLGLVSSGRVSGDLSELRVFGRFLVYEPLVSGDFVSRAARGGLAYRSSTRLDRRTNLVTTLGGSIGSLQAARGTDGAPAQLDPISSQRSTWTTSGSATFVIETSELTTVSALAGVDVSGTLSESIGSDSRRGLDYVVARSRLSVLHRYDPRTFIEGALLAERMHSEYILPGASPASPSAGPLDGGAATATAGVFRLLSRQTTASATAGLTFAIPRFGEAGFVLPIASAGVIHTEDVWSFSTLASFQYALAQARVGPGAATTLTAIFVGKPLGGHDRDALDVVAEASAQRASISAGPNDGGSVTSAGGSLMFRWSLGGGFGLLGGYDVRSIRFVPPAGEIAPPWYVRHLGFLGLSYAFSGTGNVSPLPSLARPNASPFAP